MASQTNDTSISNSTTANSSVDEGYPSIRFKSPSLLPINTIPSPTSLKSHKILGLHESTSTTTMVNERRSISPPRPDRPEDQTVRDSPVSARSLSTPPLPQIPGSPNSAKPLPSYPPNATVIPQKNPERYAPSRISNMTHRTQEKPLASEKRRSAATQATTRRVESMAPSYTSTITPGKRARTPGPFDRISTEPNFAQRVFDAGKCDLLYEVDESTRWPWKFEDVKHGVLDLGTLMRMQQHVLQQKLVAQVNALGQKGAWMEIGVGETMKEYCKFTLRTHTASNKTLRTNTHSPGQLTRDMDYITSTSTARPSATLNPFLISTTDTLEAQLLEEGGLIARKGASSPTSPTTSDPTTDFEKHISRLPYAPEAPSPWRATLRRWLAITSAAIALLLPFLIMMLVPTFASRMATTCVMIAVFALAAAASEIETKRAVAYVLGYAGLLVIFGGLAPPVVWNGVS